MGPNKNQDVCGFLVKLYCQLAHRHKVLRADTAPSRILGILRTCTIHLHTRVYIGNISIPAVHAVKADWYQHVTLSVCVCHTKPPA